MPNETVAPISGQGGSITVTGQTNAFCVEQWELDVTNELDDVTTTCSGGWSEKIATINKAILNVTLNFNGAAPHYSVFTPGTKIVATLNVGSPVGGSGAQHNYSGTFIVSGWKTTNPATKAVKETLTAENTGVVTFT